MDCTYTRDCGGSTITIFSDDEILAFNWPDRMSSTTQFSAASSSLSSNLATNLGQKGGDDDQNG